MHTQKPEPVKHMDETEIGEALTLMEQDSGLNTGLTYTKNDVYPVRSVSFYEKHMSYLMAHPKINPASYLSNLRTMIKIRSK